MVFLDKKGNERRIDFTLRSIHKVKEYLEFDLVSDDLGKRLQDNPEFFLEVIWVLSRSKNESYKSFLKSLNKKIITYITNKFVEGLQDCFKTNYATNDKEKNGGERKVSLRTFVELAGSCNCACFMDLTPGELIDYKVAYDKSRWTLQSVLLAMVNNTHCSKQSDLKRPKDFNPFEKQDEQEIVCDLVDLLMKGK